MLKRIILATTIAGIATMTLYGLASNAATTADKVAVAAVVPAAPTAPAGPPKAPAPSAVPTPQPPPADTSQLRAGSITPKIARGDAIAYVRGLTYIAKRIDQVEAKLTTAGLWALANGQPERVSGLDPLTPIWVISVTGQFEMQAGHGQEYPWGAILLDARTGEPIGSAAAPARPAAMDTIVDLAPKP